MHYETISLSVPGAQAPAELVAYVPDNFPDLGIDRRRPALIICPGGGYEKLSNREGEPVALRFAGLGYAAFVLYYHVAPQVRYPIPQRQLLAAIDHVRTHAEEYHVDPAAVISMGFSAGGHLAGCAALLWNRPEIVRPMEKKPAAYRPDGAVLCYPVVSAGSMGHRNSFLNLLGDQYEKKASSLSLENQVRKDAPPFFLWHTADDTTVPMENTRLLQTALRDRGIPVETHIFPHGVHGQSLADATVFPPERRWQISVPCAAWVERCHAWLQRNFCGSQGGVNTQNI